MKRVPLLALLALLAVGCEGNLYYDAEAVDPDSHLRLKEDDLTSEQREDVRCWEIYEGDSHDRDPSHDSFVGIACLESR
jgi:hypothetical protein